MNYEIMISSIVQVIMIQQVINKFESCRIPGIGGNFVLIPL